jgi:hypothetical protein
MRVFNTTSERDNARRKSSNKPVRSAGEFDVQQTKLKLQNSALETRVVLTAVLILSVNAGETHANFKQGGDFFGSKPAAVNSALLPAVPNRLL